MSYNSDRINIHELTVEEPEKQEGLPFDPERDLTEEDWVNMKKQLEKYKIEEDWSKFSEHAMAMRVIDPDIDLGIEDTDWENMETQLNDFRENATSWGQHQWANFASQASKMKIIDSTGDLRLDQAVWNGMNSRLSKYKKDKEWSGCSWLAMCMKILDPSIKLDFSEEDWVCIKDLAGKSTNVDINSIQFLAEIKIINPDIHFKLSDENWANIKDILDQVRNSQLNPSGTNGVGVLAYVGGVGVWHNFSVQAMLMKILAAEEVRVTDEGLQIKMTKDQPLKSDTLPIPETKQF